MNRLFALAVLVVLSLSRAWERSPPPEPLAPERDIASLLPERCRVYVEGPGLHAVFRRGLEHAFLAALGSTPFGRALHEDGRAPEQGIARADAWLGEPVLPLLAELSGRGVALGFDPGIEKAVVVALATEEDIAQRALGSLLAAVERQFGLTGALREPHARDVGAEVWFLGDGVVARRGELVVLANDRELMTDVLELASDPSGRGLLDRTGFEARRGARPTDAVLWAWIQLEELESSGDEGLRALRKGGRTPAAQGILGAALSVLGGGSALSSSLTLDGRGLELRARALDAPSVPALLPGARDGQLPATVEGPNLGTALLYRDYATFLSRRSELFPVEAQSHFAEAITTVALFFGGRDLGAEVLPHLSPWVRLIAREVEFEVERCPEITLPALAAIGVLDEPLEGEAWVTAFQSLIAILGIENAQKGEEGLRLRLTEEDGVELTSARFPTPRIAEGIDLKYNLEPAMGVVGRHLVVGTHFALVRELLRELGEASPFQGESERLHLDPRALAPFVTQNFEALKAQKVLSDGLEPAAAAREIEGLRLALASLSGLDLVVNDAATSAPEAVLTLTFQAHDGR